MVVLPLFFVLTRPFPFFSPPLLVGFPPQIDLCTGRITAPYFLYGGDSEVTGRDVMQVGIPVAEQGFAAIIHLDIGYFALRRKTDLQEAGT